MAFPGTIRPRGLCPDQWVDALVESNHGGIIGRGWEAEGGA
jgi:hypothetical protein